MAKGKVVEAKKRTDEQKKAIEDAKEAVNKAHEALMVCQKDVEKFKIHKGEWTKEEKKLATQEAASEQEEVSTAGSVRKRKQKGK